jgi:hypothetical protein
VRLGLVAAKPTDAVTYGLLPAAARLGLEVFLLTDQPDGHAGALARARPDLGPAGQGAADRGPAGQGAAGQGVRPRIVGCDVHDVRALVGRIAGLPRMDAVFSNSDHLQAQTALAADYFGLPGKDWRSCLRAKNKPLMRRRLAETGAEKVTAAEIAPGDEPPAGLPYPVALKPAEGVASEDVTLVGSPGELAERCAEFFGRRPGEKLMAEEYLPGTLRTLETLGGGELAHTAAAAPGRPLAFGGPGKTPAELAAALEPAGALGPAGAPGRAASVFHVESPHELALLDQAARAAGRRADVLLRVNLPGPSAPDEQAALVMGGKPSPFGMDVELLRRCAGALTPAVRLRGLHAHLASGVGADGLLAAARGWSRSAANGAPPTA